MRCAAPRQAVWTRPAICCQVGVPEEEGGDEDGRVGDQVMPGRGGSAQGGSCWRLETESSVAPAHHAHVACLQHVARHQLQFFGDYLSS